MVQGRFKNYFQGNQSKNNFFFLIYTVFFKAVKNVRPTDVRPTDICPTGVHPTDVCLIGVGQKYEDCMPPWTRRVSKEPPKAALKRVEENTPTKLEGDFSSGIF